MIRREGFDVALLERAEEIRFCATNCDILLAIKFKELDLIDIHGEA